MFQKSRSVAFLIYLSFIVAHTQQACATDGDEKKGLAPSRGTVQQYSPVIPNLPDEVAARIINIYVNHTGGVIVEPFYTTQHVNTRQFWRNLCPLLSVSSGMQRMAYQSVVFMNNKLTGIEDWRIRSHIARMTELSTLYVYDPNITDKLLSELTNLTHLEITVNKKVTDDSVKLLTKLICLKIDEWTSMTDESLSCLVKLKTLDLKRDSYSKGNILMDINSVSCLTNLQKLNCSRGTLGIKDSVLRSLTTLTKLVLVESPKITDLSLSILTNLQILAINKNNITESCVEMLKGKGLKKIHLY